MALTSYDLSNGSTQSLAITAGNDYLNMKISSGATEISRYITILLEYSLDAGTSWHELKDNKDNAIKKVVGGSVDTTWLVTDLPAGVSSLRQRIDIPEATTGTISITDYVGT